jgi:uncharacterized membrane protein YedE/YeeE
MHHLLANRPPALAIGPAIGLVLVGLLWLANLRMGVLGGVSDIVERTTGRQRILGWKGWFVIGIVGGGLLFRVLAGHTSVGHGYGWLTRELGDGAVVGIGAVLLTAGVLIGFGAKTAGGCTSGNGLSGVAFGSRGSMVAMATFMSTAIAASFAIKALT